MAVGEDWLVLSAEDVPDGLLDDDPALPFGEEPVTAFDADWLAVVSACGLDRFDVEVWCDADPECAPPADEGVSLPSDGDVPDGLLDEESAVPSDDDAPDGPLDDDPTLPSGEEPVTAFEDDLLSVVPPDDEPAEVCGDGELADSWLADPLPVEAELDDEFDPDDEDPPDTGSAHATPVPV